MSPRPNIVVIVVDALRADHLPFYGYTKNTAPFLNTLSGQASIFVNTFSSSNWTSPAVASLFTSIYPFQQNIKVGNLLKSDANSTIEQYRFEAIAESVTTIAEILKKNGYRTYGLSSNLFISEPAGFALGFDRFQSFRMKTDAEILNLKIKEWQGEITASPYFLYIHYTDVHIPYLGRPPLYKPQKTKKHDFLARYDSNIYYIDQKIKQLFTELQWSHNTVLIVTADHGEEFWEHGYRGHGKDLFNGSVKVPLFIYFPEYARKSRFIRQNVSTIDILPTICKIIGTPTPLQAEGIDLLPAIRSDSKYLNGRSHYLYTERGVFNFQGIIRNNWKLIINRTDGKLRLFDLKNDPNEKNNLAKSEEFAHIRLDLAGRFLAFERNCRKYGTKKIRGELTPERIKELKAFGYLN